MIISPLFVYTSRKSKFILNINNYRNENYHVLNKAKKEYKYSIESQLIHLPSYNKIRVYYTLYPKTKRRTDITNVCSIHSKFFLDALVDAGHIKDDDYTHVTEEVFKFGRVNKENPCVIIQIKEVK